MLVKTGEFFNFMDYLSKDSDVFYPALNEFSNETIFAKWLGQKEKIVIGGFRPTDPIKDFFFPAKNDVMVSPTKKRILIGVKNCDLKAIELLDKALLEGDYVDPIYRDLRANTIIIASDCTDTKESCHCILQAIKPYPESNFDISISILDDNLLLKAGSAKGKDLLKILSDEFYVQKEFPDLLDAVSHNRESIVSQLEKINDQWSRSGFMEKVDLDLKNQELFKPCIECGGCNFICPTCYCFLMGNSSSKKGPSKLRSWDACQLKGYARVAGGANARPELFQRFNHRYGCKFNYMFKQFQMSGCTGCGRCIDVCPAEIDIRDVMRKLKKPSEAKENE